MPSSPRDFHPDVETINSIMDKQPIRMFTRNCIPPKDPPPGTLEPCVWRCPECKQEYRISVTSRCIKCPSYNSKPPYKYISSDDLNGESTTETRQPRRSRKFSKRPSPLVYEYDYEFWAQYNDWKRFRSEYEANPKKWERRIKRNFDGRGSAQRRAKRYKVEVITRTLFTEDRLKRMLKRKHNCELDCDYPSQCQTERYEASRKIPPKTTIGALHPPWYGEGEENAGKLPLCELLPQFDQEITSPEDIDDEDEIFAAYKRDVDAWFASTQANLAK
jgi:hypothetical protein